MGCLRCHSIARIPFLRVGCFRLDKCYKSLGSVNSQQPTPNNHQPTQQPTANSLICNYQDSSGVFGWLLDHLLRGPTNFPGCKTSSTLPSCTTLPRSQGEKEHMGVFCVGDFPKLWFCLWFSFRTPKWLRPPPPQKKKREEKDKKEHHTTSR